MWNALVGYCGLVSIGQQAFFGLGAYFAVRLADSGVSVYPSLFLAALIVGALSLPLSALMLRLKGGEFAIGMWVVSELAHLLVNLDTLINGETGTSLIALNAYPTDLQTRADLLVRLRRHGRPAGGRLLPAARADRRGDPGDPRQRAGGRVDRRARDARQADRLRPRRLRRGARRRAVGGDGGHLPAEDLFQPAMDRLHDLHGAGRRPRHVRRRDPRRRRVLRHRGMVRRRRRLVPRRPRRGGAGLRARLAARNLGLGRGQDCAAAAAGRLPRPIPEPRSARRSAAAAKSNAT